MSVVLFEAGGHSLETETGQDTAGEDLPDLVRQPLATFLHEHVSNLLGHQPVARWLDHLLHFGPEGDLK